MNKSALSQNTLENFILSNSNTAVALINSEPMAHHVSSNELFLFWDNTYCFTLFVLLIQN